jgi:hypothetical protein
MRDHNAGLRRATRRAAERAAGERREASGGGGGPRPGDLYALPATAEHEVEWLAVATEGSGGWVVLPADSTPFAAPGEVEVAADEPGGPLTLHARFPVVVPEALLAPERRTGRVSGERRAAAERRWRRLADGEAAEPVYDPDDRRRLEELAAAQRTLAAAAARRGGEEGGRDGGGGASGGGTVPVAAPERLRRRGPARFRPPPWMSALAAGLALAVLALLGWNLSLLRQVERLGGVQEVVRGPEVVVDERTRGEVVVPAGEEDVLISLAWAMSVEPEARFRVSLVAPGGEILSQEDVRPRDNESFVKLPRSTLIDGAVLRVVRLRGDVAAGEVAVWPIRLERR